MSAKSLPVLLCAFTKIWWFLQFELIRNLKFYVSFRNLLAARNNRWFFLSPLFVMGYQASLPMGKQWPENPGATTLVAWDWQTGLSIIRLHTRKTRNLLAEASHTPIILIAVSHPTAVSEQPRRVFFTVTEKFLRVVPISQLLKLFTTTAKIISTVFADTILNDLFDNGSATLNQHNSPVHWARELSKPSKLLYQILFFLRLNTLLKY